MSRATTALLAALAATAFLALAGSAAAATAHPRCPGAAAHHHDRVKGKLSRYCRQKAAHRRCRKGGHHHHRARGRLVHYCAAPKVRSSQVATVPAPGTGPVAGSPPTAPPPPAAAVPTTGAPAPAPDPSGDTTTSPVDPARLQVTAREFTLTLSRPEIVAGPALMELVNRGEDPHDLRVRQGATALGALPETASGERGTLAVELAPGSYTLFCSLPGHEALGMTAALQVTTP